MGIRKTSALAVLALALALLSTGCVSTEARKVKLPWYSGFIGGGGGTPFTGTLAAGVPLTLTGATSGTTGLSAAAVTTGSVNYSMPSGDGNAFSVLTTNGSHVLNWQTLQAGTGITLTRSGNTTTIASTGGGGGGGGGGSVNPTSTVISLPTGLTTSNASPDLQGGSDRDFHISSAGAHKLILSDTTNNGGAIVFDQANSAVYPQTDQDDDLGTSSIAWSTLYVASIKGSVTGPLQIYCDSTNANQVIQFRDVSNPDTPNYVIVDIQTQTMCPSSSGAMDLGVSGKEWSAVWLKSLHCPTGVATSTTTSLVFLPTCAGVPTGAAAEGAMIVDSTNHHAYCRLGGTWHQLDN